MSLVNLPRPLDQIFKQERNFSRTKDIARVFDRLMVAMVELLQCDRCYLYIRDPEFLVGQVLHCHCASSTIPDLRNLEPHSEPIYWVEKDPLFAAALQCEQFVFIEDLNSLELPESDGYYFLQNYQEQKSLIQAHLCSEKQLWGIIQASKFDRPRVWTQFDRSLMATVVDKVTPLVSMYVKRKLRQTVQEVEDGRIPKNL